MEALALHIQYLLLQNDCVILPGLGAFISVYTPAYFDIESRRWMPMTREVRFTTKLAQNDGLLIKSYMRQLNLSYKEAEERVANDISLIREVISCEGEAVVGSIGCLIDMGDNIISLFSFRNKFKDVAKLGKLSIPPFNYQNEENIINVSTGQTLESRFNTSKNYYLPINKLFAKTAAMFILIVTICCCLLIPSDLSKETKNEIVESQKIHTISESISNENLSCAENIDFYIDRLL